MFCNVLYCSMGSEHYVSHAGIGFGGFIYILFYCSILLLSHTRLMRWEASALCEGGLSNGKKYFAFVVSRNNRTIPKKIPQTLAGLGLENVLGLGTLQNNVHFSRTMLDLCMLDKQEKLCYAGDQHK